MRVVERNVVERMVRTRMEKTNAIVRLRTRTHVRDVPGVRTSTAEKRYKTTKRIQAHERTHCRDMGWGCKGFVAKIA